MATETQLKAYVKGSGRNWDQKCQAFVYQICAHFGHAPVPYLSANAARAASKIVSKNAKSAPAGSTHYWSIGAYGHVAAGLGGERVAMGSKYVDVSWGINAGATTVSRYTARTGARYLGWSYSNGANDFAFSPAAAPASAGVSAASIKKVAAYLNKQKLGKTSTAAQDGQPGAVFWWLVQTWGKKHAGYSGTVDGKVGPLTRKVLAALIKKVA